MTDNRSIARNRWTAAGLLLVVAMIFFTFSPCLKNGFLHYDDQHYLVENPLVKQFSLNNTAAIFSSMDLGLYVPLVIFSYSLEHYLFGLNPEYYHLDNLLLHIVNSLLVFWLIMLICGRRSAAFLVTLLFALHPLRVESVAWLTERKDVLYSAFFLLSIILYLYYRKGNRKRFYYSSLGMFLLSLFSKPMAVSLPLILVLLDYYLDKKWLLKKWLEKIPFFLLSAVFTLIGIFYVTLFAQDRMTGAVNKLVVLMTGLPLYLSKTFWPVRLSVHYPVYPEKIYPHLALTLTVTFLLVLGFLYVFRKLWHHIRFSFLFSVIIFAPVIPALWDGYPHANRYTYLASIGLFYMLVVLLDHSVRRVRLHSRIWITASLLIGVIGVISLSLLTRRHCRYWQDDFPLWRYSVDAYPTAIGHYNLGMSFLQRDDVDSAFDHFSRALALDPANDKALNNRGLLLERQGRYTEALEDLNRAVAADGNQADYYYNRGLVYLRLKRFKAGVADFTAAVGLNPYYNDAYYLRAVALLELGIHQLARQDLDRVLALNPRDIEALFLRGTLFQKLGRLTEALNDFHAVIRTAPGFEPSYHRILEIQPENQQIRARLQELQRTNAPLGSKDR